MIIPPDDPRGMTTPEKSPEEIAWICEDHKDKPQGHDGCKGAGMPQNNNRVTAEGIVNAIGSSPWNGRHRKEIISDIENCLDQRDTEHKEEVEVLKKYINDWQADPDLLAKIEKLERICGDSWPHKTIAELTKALNEIAGTEDIESRTIAKEAIAQMEKGDK